MCKPINDNKLLAFVMGDQADYLTSILSATAITTELPPDLDTVEIKFREVVNIFNSW